MEFAVSFAMDGNGNHYLFDMSIPRAVNINTSAVQVTGYDDCKLIGNSFLQVCRTRYQLMKYCWRIAHLTKNDI